MIGSACYQKEGADALERAMAVYRPNDNDADTITSLDAYVNEKDGVGAVWYPRYWHGYLSFNFELPAAMERIIFRESWYLPAI